MAMQFASIVYGKPIESVTFDTLTLGGSVEIRYDDAVLPTKDQLLDHIGRIVAAIQQANFPAAGISSGLFWGEHQLFWGDEPLIWE